MTCSPLESPGWIEFNSWRTGLRPHHFTEDVGGDAAVHAVLYLDKRGRVVMPSANPYLPVCFTSERATPASRTSAWLRGGKALSEELAGRGVTNQLHFPPGLADMRPFKWNGYRVSVRYTYVLDLPMDEARLSSQSRKAIRRAQRANVRIERTDDLDAVLACLEYSERRQRFSHTIGRRELEAAQRLLGWDAMRMYVAFDADGKPASTVVNLHTPGTRAIGWLSGSTDAGLRDGIGLAILHHEFSDLTAARATAIDLCGANIESVAEYKSHWGPELVATYSIREYSLRTAVRYALDHRSGNQRRRQAAGRRPKEVPAGGWLGRPALWGGVPALWDGLPSVLGQIMLDRAHPDDDIDDDGSPWPGDLTPTTG